MRRAFVTGGTGMLGGAVARHLVESGFDVASMVRRPARRGGLPDGALLHSGDVRSAAALKAVLRPGDVVVHLAARKRGMSAAAFRTNVGGTATVVQAACEAGAARLIVASSIHVYGCTPCGSVADESTPPRPLSAYAASKLAAEEVAFAAADRLGGTEVVVLRIAAAYGSDGSGAVGRLAAAIARMGPFAIVPWGRSQRTVVHVEDVAAAVAIAATHSAAAGRTYNVTDGEVRSVRAIVTELCRRLDRPVPPLRLPFPLRSLAVDGSRIQRELGFAPSLQLENAPC
jgi:nucleoside-diphosphate-sugar epimerase